MSLAFTFHFSHISNGKNIYFFLTSGIDRTKKNHHQYKIRYIYLYKCVISEPVLFRDQL